MRLTFPVSWRVVREELLESGRVIILIGGVDSGKSTFCSFFLREASNRGLRCGIIDADVGQSDVGPPTTIGFAQVDAEFRGLRSLHPERLYFVGSITPEGSLLRMVTGMGKILKYATSLSLDRLIIDTTGFIHGDSAVELKHQLIEIVSPDSIVAIQRGSECEPLIQPFDSTSKIYRVPVPRDVTQRSRVERRRRRLRAFQAYFKDSNQIHFPFSAIRVSGVTALQKILPYDAITHNYGVFKGMEEIAHIGGEDLRGLLVGLINGQGETLSIGIIEGVDSEKKELCIRSPLIDYLNVKRIHFSDYRLERAECV